MKAAIPKKNSLYTQFTQLFVLATFIGILTLFFLDLFGTFIVQHILEDQHFITYKNQLYAEKFQDFVDREQIESRDSEWIHQWVKEQKILSIRIYKDGIQVFDSDYPNQEIWEEEILANHHEWENYHAIEFKDGTGELFIVGIYDYQLYNMALVIELILAFIVILIVILMGIRYKIKYILLLRDEIEILEGGSLDYPITVRGKDELTSLAEGLDEMRISFKNAIRQEEKIQKENQRMVTEMSHDLRTPITSMLLYIEILKQENYQDKKHFYEYLNKIERKAERMKQLTEHLFEYSLNVNERTFEDYSEVFYDLLSETGFFLQEQGYDVDFQMEWKNCRIQVSMEYILRIFDNVTSNILKYADPEGKIIISSIFEENRAGIEIQNQIGRAKPNVESTGIGLDNIKNMIKMMDGQCRVEKNPEKYSITLLFLMKN